MQLHKIRHNIYVFLGILAIGIVVLSVFLVDKHIQSRLDQEYQQLLSEALLASTDRASTFIESQQRLINLLYNTPPIQGISRAINNDGVDPFDGTSLERWEFRLATIFSSTLKAYPEVTQIRLINATDGMEWIRADRSLASVEILPKSKLQNKSNRDYVIDTLKLPERSVYISQITLNREQGKIEYPFHPTMRFAMPAYNVENEIFAVLVVNVDANTLFDQIDTSDNLDIKFLLTDVEQRVIYSQIDQMKYWPDLNPELSLRSEFTVIPWTKQNISRLTSAESEIDWLLKSHFFRLSGKDLNHGFNLHSYINFEHYQEQLSSERFQSFFILTIVTLVFVVIFISLTISLRRARQLGDIRSEYEGIINGSNNAIIAIKRDGAIFIANDTATEYFFELRGKLKGVNVSTVASLPQKYILESIWRISEHEEPEKYACEQRIVNEKIYLEYSASKIVDARGELAGVAIVAEDITARKFAEKALADSNVNLQNTVAERTRELEEAKNKAEQVSEVKSRFISTVSHEMRTPLNGVMGTLRMLKSEALSDNQLRYLTMSETSCETLNCLINDVLDISKIEAGKFELEVEEFNVISVIEHACLSLALKAKEKSLEFIMDIDDVNHIALKGDASRLTQIIFNLLSNAIKFTQNGHVKLYASSEQHQDNVALQIEVSDTGIGISKEYQKNLFDSFTQADARIARSFGGSGLGLSIAKRLAELMNGNITVESSEGKGSSFLLTISFPLVGAVLRQESSFLDGKSFDTSLIANKSFEPSLRKIILRYGGIIDSKNADYTFKSIDDETNEAIEKPLPNQIYITDTAYRDVTDSAQILRRPIRIIDVINLFVPHLAPALIKIESQRKNIDSQGVNLSRLGGARLLVVDDNDINLEVAKGIFHDSSITVETATSGQEAINILSAAKQGSFDCILLDINMPGLNGYETAKFIRNESAVAHFKDIPIIAMTANAMTGEYERCLNAGMNDYVAKPVVVDTLISKLTAHIIIDPLTPKESDTALPIETTSSAIDIENAINRMAGNEKIFKKIANMFIDQIPDEMNKLEIALTDGDLESASSISHNLKGVSGNIGAMTLSNLFLEVEQSVRSNKPLDNEIIKQIRHHVDMAINELKGFIMR